MAAGDVNANGVAWTGMGRTGYGQGNHGSQAFTGGGRQGRGGKLGATDPGGMTLRRQIRKNKNVLGGLNKTQDLAIDQRSQADLSLGNQANNMLPGIMDAYNQPFDWKGLPSAPVQGDFNDWRQGQIDSTYGDFTKRFDPQFAKANEDFEQQMANRGIPVGSELYNNQKQLLTQGQNDARQSAMVQAQGIAGQNAGQFFDIGTQARSNALGEGLQQRNMPLAEFNQLYASRSPFDLQNLSYSQQRGLQDQQFQNAKNMPRGGGGGGGGGGGAEWQQMGFSSPMEYYAFKQAESRANKQWEWDNNPQYNQGGGGMNPYAGMVGGILGAGIGGWASTGFDW